MGFRRGNRSTTWSSSSRRALGCGAATLVLLLAGCSADQPSDTTTSKGPHTAGSATPVRAGVTIGPIAVSDADKPDTLFEFRANAQVPEPPKTLRCQISFDEIVFTAAGTMAEEPNSGVDFSLTVATGALDFTESLFDVQGYEIICTAAGAQVTKRIDRMTGEVVAASPSPTSSKRPPIDPADAPAIQINIEDFEITKKRSDLAFEVGVEGGTQGSQLGCEVRDLGSEIVAEDTMQLVSGQDAYPFKFDLSDRYQQLMDSAWLIFVCEVDKATAYETVARP